MKRDRIQLYLIVLLAGGLLAGCTAGTVEDIVPEESRPVELRFSKPDLGTPVLLSRAGEEVTVPAAPATPLPEGATVRIYGYLRGEVGAATAEVPFSTAQPSFEVAYVVEKDGSMSPCLADDAGVRQPGEGTGPVVRGGVYDFYAVSPARRLVKDAEGKYVVTAIPHKEDVMTSFARGVTVSRSSRVVTLETFRRQCALLVFNVAPARENALPFDELYGTRLELSHISVSGATLIAGEDTGILPTGGENKAEATVVFESAEFVAVEAGSAPDGMGLNKTTGIVLPKNERPFGVEINVQRNHETATLKATIDQPIAFDAGKRYVFTLEVKNDESRLNLKIIDWNAISFSDGEVGAPPGGSYPDPDIQEGIGTTITVAKWTKIEWSDTDVGGGESLKQLKTKSNETDQ